MEDLQEVRAEFAARSKELMEACNHALQFVSDERAAKRLRKALEASAKRIGERTATVRMPREIYEAARKAALLRGTSLNLFCVEAIAAALEGEPPDAG